jgi:serine/threonine protein kinase
MTGTIRDDDGDEPRLAPVPEGELVADKYVAGPTLGVGGMGVVIAATDRVLDRKVAIKFLLPSLAHSERSVRRFIREARAASRITSEHVARILEIARLKDGTPFIVMEYLDGRDLKKVLAENGPLPPERAVDYLLQAIEAIAEGHRSDVIHRDLKPSNLFVTRRIDGTELIKVLDFGIAKTREPVGTPDAALTGSDDVHLGSPLYMSPEQLVKPSSVDARSDVWALGVTLYELVTNQQPFDGENHTQLVLSITGATPTPPSKRRPELGIPPELDRVIMRCLEKNGAGRYTTVADVATALAPFASRDARPSLERIRRISAAPSEPLSKTTTLPGIDVLPRLSPPPRSRSAASRTRRVVATTSIALFCAVLGVVAWKRSVSSPVRTSPASADAVVVPQEVTPATPPPVSPVVEVAPPAASVSVPVSATRPAVPTHEIRQRMERAPLARASVAEPAVAPPTPSGSVVEEPPAPPEASSREPQEGRSPLIERLIEKRR